MAGKRKKKTISPDDKLTNFEYCTGIPDDFDVMAFKEFLDDNEFIHKYAFIIHDKDLKEDGSLAHRHIHCMIQIRSSNRVSRIAEIMDCKIQHIQFIESTWAKALAYLTHQNKPNKHQYSDDEVISNFVFQKEREERAAKEKEKSDLAARFNSLLEAVSNGQIQYFNVYDTATTLNIPRRYLIKNFNQIDRAFRAYDLCGEKEIDRNLETIFIYGPSATGKTTLAKYIAKQRGFSIFISGSNNDILDGYGGEECIIIDDVRSNTFDNFNDALKLLDPYTSSKYRSRYRNKTIRAKLIIMTSTHELKDIFYNNDEEFKQIERRVSTIIRLSDEHIYISEQRGIIKKLDNTIRSTILQQAEEENRSANDGWVSNIVLDITESKNSSDKRP